MKAAIIVVVDPKNWAFEPLLIFDEEEEALRASLNGSAEDLLQLFPGKAYLGHAATELGARQSQRIPDEPEEFHLRVNVRGPFLAVNHKTDPAHPISFQACDRRPHLCIDGPIFKPTGCRSERPLRLIQPAVPGALSP